MGLRQTLGSRARTWTSYGVGLLLVFQCPFFSNGSLMRRSIIQAGWRQGGCSSGSDLRTISLSSLLASCFEIHQTHPTCHSRTVVASRSQARSHLNIRPRNRQTPCSCSSRKTQMSFSSAPPTQRTSVVVCTAT